MSKVILVSKTHLDLGFTNLAQNIVDQYLQVFIPNAVSVAREVNREGKKFVWTVGSWILNEALENGTEILFTFASPLYGHSVEYADGTVQLLLKRTPSLSDDARVPLAGVRVLLDPGLVVLGGDVAQAGGPKLAERVQEATARIAPNATEVGLGKIEGSPVVRGALLQALEHARDDVFSSTV